MIIKNNKGLSIRNNYDLLNLYLFNKEEIECLHDIYDLLEKKFDNKWFHDRIQENSNLILNLYNVGKNIDFWAEFITFFDDNKEFYNNIIKQYLWIKLDIKDWKFYNSWKGNNNSQKEENKIKLIILYLQNKYISAMEKILNEDNNFLLGNYLNSKYKIIDDMWRWTIRLNIDCNIDYNIDIDLIKSYIRFIKRISIPEIEIRFYYQNVTKDNYKFISYFIELNEDYNNIFHYIYTDDLDKYEYISEDLFGDFIRYIYMVNLSNNFFTDEINIKKDLSIISSNNDFIWVEVFIKQDIVELWIESLIYNVYSSVEQNWWKIFKINLEEIIFNKKADVILKSFVDKNIKYFFEQFNIKDKSILNIKEITLFNIMYIYQIYFNVNNINKNIIEIEMNDIDLYNQISYILNNNPFSLYYKNYKADLLKETLTDLSENITIDFPLIEGFDKLMWIYNIHQELTVNDLNLLPIRNISIPLEKTEHYLINKLI